MAFVIAVLKIILSLAIQAYLSKQDDQKGPGASKIVPDSVNTASADKTIPTFFGRVRYNGANLLWYGDKRTETVYDEVSAGFIADLINGKQKIFVGYKYYLGMQVAIGFSLDDTPIEIYSMYTDQDVFLFKETTPFSSTGYYIDKPNAYGGTGNLPNGWQGVMEYYDGTQTISDPYLESKIGAGEVPVYPGLAHMVFEQNFIGTSPNPKTISFELRHVPVPSWGNSTDASIGDDYNPVYALWYMLTDKTVGAGVDPLLIDTENFNTVAGLVKDEGIGISIAVTNQIVFSDFQKTVEDILAAQLYVDFKDGKYKIKLNRDDYIFDDLRMFTESDISKLSWNKPTSDSLMSEVKVQFENRENDYQGDIAIYSDLAVRYNKQASKGTTLNFTWIKDAETASKIAGRELKSLSYPLVTGSFITSSKHIDLNRGDVIRLNYAPDEMDIAVRILSIDYGLFEDNKVRIDFAEDFFGRFDSNFEAPPASKFFLESEEALDVNSYYVEAPFFFNKEEFGSNFIIIAEQPNQAHFEYNLYTDVNGQYEKADDSTFSPTAQLNTAVSVNDNSIVIKNSLLIERIRTHTVSEIRQGNNLIVIDDTVNKEWIAFESITDNLDGTYTLNNVKRGLFHTKQKDFAVDSKVLFISYGNTYISTLIDGSVNYKLLSRTPSDNLTINEATTVSAVENRLNMDNYPVINLKLNNQYFPTTAPLAGFDITWSFQNRNEINFFTDDKTYDGNSICSIDIYEDSVFVRNEQVNGKTYSYVPTGGSTEARFVISNITTGYDESEVYDITVSLV